MKELFPEIPCLKSDRLVIRALTREDAPGLKEMVDSEKVYRMLPTFLFEKKYDDIYYVIDHLYDECLEDSLILGVFENGEFCGLAELYGYIGPLHKISIGQRYLEKSWGRGIATEAMQLLLDYIQNELHIEIITASTMLDNIGSATVLRKTGFELVVHASEEDWGFPEPLPTDKWIW